MSHESTTPDLVEVVKGLFEAADRGDWGAVVKPYAPDCIWEDANGITNAVGASELRGFWEDWAGMFEDFTVKVDAVVDPGKGIVYAVYHMEGRPARSSTGVVTLRAALIYEWVDSLIKRLIVRQDIDEARADAERLAQSRG